MWLRSRNVGIDGYMKIPLGNFLMKKFLMWLEFHVLKDFLEYRKVDEELCQRILNGF